MRQAFHELIIPTRGRGLRDFTGEVEQWIAENKFRAGLLTLHLRHTSASLLIQENADPTVRDDLEAFFHRLVPAGDDYQHDAEGPDDMPAHIKAALTQTQLSIPVQNGRMLLGLWQGIYLWEHRAIPHRRELALHVIGD